MSKLSTISNLISTALIDGKISDEELKMFMDEIEKDSANKDGYTSKNALGI